MDPLIELSPGALEAWAGPKIFARGRAYQRSGAVLHLARLQDGGLIAEVEGTMPYRTRIEMEDGEPIADCTCPYDWICKHAIAPAAPDEARPRHRDRRGERGAGKCGVVAFDWPPLKWRTFPYIGRAVDILGCDDEGTVHVTRGHVTCEPTNRPGQQGSSQPGAISPDGGRVGLCGGEGRLRSGRDLTVAC